MTKSIHHKLFFSHPPELVWEYLTRADLMALWLMPNDFLPIVGHDFQFRVKPIPAMEFDGIVYCKVLVLAACTKLSYSWKCGPGDGHITVDSMVQWTLLPKDNGTELLLAHDGFTGMENAMLLAGMNQGWLNNMHKIDTFIKETAHGTTNA